MTLRAPLLHNVESDKQHGTEEEDSPESAHGLVSFLILLMGGYGVGDGWCGTNVQKVYGITSRLAQTVAESNPMNTLGTMIESLVADDPRRSSDRLLEKMCQIAGADGGAILIPQGDNANVFLSYRLPLAGLASLPIRFQDHRDRLGKGDVVSNPGFALAPLGMEGSPQVGWVYLESPRSVDAQELRPFLLGIAKALAALDEAPVVRIPSVNRADANRANILRILEENDWNIARVSRELGVTRRTLYMRLSAFGIARKKVPRLAKPLTA